MKIKKSTLSLVAYLFAHFILFLLLVYGLEWDPLFAAVATYFLVLFRIGTPRI